MRALQQLSVGRAPMIAVLATLSASACWLVAGTDDFSDEAAGGSNATATGGSGASGGSSTVGGQGGAQTSTGAQGGVGGVGGTGGGPPCPAGMGKPNGECCNDTGECTSGNCADGFCCNTACSQPCFGCGESGSLGTCIDACVTMNFGENSVDDFKGVTRDTYIHDNYPNRNHGVTTTLWVDNNPDYVSLIGFGLTSLPSGATVGEAILYLYVQDASNLSFGIYEILEDWDEGTFDGGTGTANWTNRFPNFMWSTPGCGSPGSSDGTALTSLLAPTVNVYVARNIDHNLVQRWVDTPSTNYGIAIRPTAGTSDVARFVSSEGVDGQRPSLAVKYRP